MAEITGGELQYVATMDVSQLKEAILSSEKGLVGFSDLAVKVGEALDGTFNKSAGSVKDYTGIVKENISIQKQVIKELEASIKEVQDRAGKMGPGIAQASVIASSKELQRELDAEKKSLFELETAIKGTEVSTTTLSTKFLAAKNTLAELTLANKQGTPEFAKAEAEVKKLGLALNETNKNAKTLSSGGSFAGVIQSASLLSGGLAAAQSVMGLLGGENENLNKIMLKTQALMSVSITLQQLQTNVQTGGILSTTSLTSAKNFLTAANTRLAVALGISNVAATVLMATLTVGLSVAVAGVIYLMSQYGKEAEKMSAMNKKVADSVAEPLVAYKNLQSQWNALGDDLKAKEQFVIDNKEAFEKLGVSVTGVSDAENVLKNKSAEFVQAMMLRAKATILAQKAIENMKNSINLEKEYKRKNIDKDLTVGEIAMRTLTGGVGGITSNRALKAEAEEVRKSKQANIDLANEQLKVELEISELNKKSNFNTPSKSSKKANSIKVSNPKNSISTKQEEVLLEGSLAALRSKLSEIQEAFSKTNDEITRDTLNQEKLLVESQIKAIEDKYTIKEDEAAKEKAELEKKLQEFLVSQRNYEEKVIALKESYAKLRSVATTDDERNKIDAGMQADLQSLKDKNDKLLSDAQMSLIKSSKEWEVAFGQLEGLSNTSLQVILDKLLEFQEKSKGTLSLQDSAELTKSIERIKAALRNNPFTNFTQSITGYFGALKTAKNAQIEYNKAVEVFGKGSKEAIAAQEKMIDADIEAADKKKKLIGQIQEGQAIFNAVGNGVKDLGDMFGGFDDATNDAIDSIMDIGNAAMDLGTALASGDIAGAIKAGIALIGSVFKALNGDKKKERDIKRQATVLKELENAYNAVAFAAERMVGSQKYSGQRDLIKNLEQQKIAIQAMANAEGSKKKKDKGKIDEYNAQMQAINQSITQLKEGIIKDVLQTDIPEMASKIGDALLDAFGKGEDGIDAVNRAFDDMVKNILKNQLNKVLEDQMKGVYADILKKAGFNPDGTGAFDGFTGAELEDLKAQYQKVAQNGNALAEAISAITGGTESIAQGMRGDIKGITEKTAGALESQMNAMRINQVSNLEVARSALLQLVLIEGNTRNLIQMRKDLSELNAKTKNGLAGIP